MNVKDVVARRFMELCKERGTRLIVCVPPPYLSSSSDTTFRIALSGETISVFGFLL